MIPLPVRASPEDGVLVFGRLTYNDRVEREKKIKGALVGKSILVTGASGGIGSEIALAAADEGARVAIHYHTNRRAAETLLRKIKRSGGVGILVRADVSKDRDSKKLIESVVEHFGRLDGLVNCAGIIIDRTVASMTRSDFCRVINTNLLGPFLTMRDSLPHLKKTRGAIVNISSRAALRGNFGQGNYAASKAGLEALTRTVAREFGQFHIRVNSVVPPFVLTGMTRNHPQRGRISRNARRESVLNTDATPQVVARCVVFLLSDAARSISGQRFVCDSRV